MADHSPSSTVLPRPFLLAFLVVAGCSVSIIAGVSGGEVAAGAYAASHGAEEHLFWDNAEYMKQLGLAK